MDGMAKLGFKEFLDPEDAGYIITTYLYPKDPKFDFQEFYKRLYEKGMFRHGLPRQFVEKPSAVFARGTDPHDLFLFQVKLFIPVNWRKRNVSDWETLEICTPKTWLTYSSV